MIKRFFIALLALCMLGSCVYDKYNPENCPSDDALYFLSFVLRTPTEPSTKGTSGGMDIGLTQTDPGEEILVGRVDLYFYDGNGNPQGEGKANWEPVLSKDFKQAVASSQSADIANTVHDFVVALRYRPYVMMVLLNMDEDFARSLKGLTIAQARAKVMENGESAWAGAKTPINYNGATKNVRPFRMSSSTYLNSGGREICEVAIPEQYVHDNEDDAKLNPFDVYVDRMAAKVNVVLEDAIFDNELEFPVPIVTQYEGIKAKVKLLGWGVNALNKSSYLYKKIDSGWSFKQADWGVNWNESSKFRSHWAQDPNYTDGTYPKNYGDFTAPATVTEADCALKYLSWNELTGEFTTVAKRTEKPLYCFENTADGSLLSTKNTDNQLFPRATHVLVKAQLIFEEGTGISSAGDVAGYTTADIIYRYKGVFYTKNNINAAIATDLCNTGAYYKDNEQKKKIDGGNVAIVHDYGERCRVEFKEDDDGNDVYDGTGALVPHEALNKDLYRADKFVNGYFYYKIPIEHLEPAANPLGTTYPTAQYGVVRNHNYIITIKNELVGIGTGIGDLDKPIVPVTEDRDYIVSVQIAVTNWRQFNTRFLFVDPSGMLITNGQIVNRWEDEGDPSVDKDDPYSWTGNGWYF